jgi:hypothetical protein
VFGDKENSGERSACAEQDPSAESSLSDCEVTVEECEVSCSELENKQSSDAEFQDDVQDAFQPEPVKYIPHPEDGMPIPADESYELRLAPEFTYKNNICVEDSRFWVEVFKEEVNIRLDNEYYCRDGKRFLLRSKYDKYGDNRNRKQFPSNSVVRKWKYNIIVEDGGYILVRPIRPVCKHYKRQLFNNEELGSNVNEFGGKHLSVSCTARVSVSGAFLCLRDTAVFACDFRDPPCEQTSFEHLDAPEKERLGKKTEIIPLFNLSDPEDTGGGIFG